MTKQEQTKLLVGNGALWLVAILLHPLSRLIPTSTGEPPQVFSLLIPIIMLLLGVASTMYLKSALGKQSGG